MRVWAAGQLVVILSAYCSKMAALGAPVERQAMEDEQKIDVILDKLSKISSKIDSIHCVLMKECGSTSFVDKGVQTIQSYQPLRVPPPWAPIDVGRPVVFPINQRPFEDGKIQFHQYSNEEGGEGSGGDVDYYRPVGLPVYQYSSEEDGEPREIPRMSAVEIKFDTFPESPGDWTSKETCPEGSLIQSLRPLVGSHTSLPDSIDYPGMDFTPDYIYALKTHCYNALINQDTVLFSLASELPQDAVWMGPTSCPPATFVSALYVVDAADSLVPGLPEIKLGCSYDDTGKIIPALGPAPESEIPWTHACPAGSAFCSLGTMILPGQKGIKAVELDCCDIPRALYTHG